MLGHESDLVDLDCDFRFLFRIHVNIRLRIKCVIFFSHPDDIDEDDGEDIFLIVIF